MHQTKTKLFCMHSCAPNSKNYSTDLLDFQFKGVKITSLAHAKCLFKMIFGHNYFISERIFKLFVALFRTHELQKDGMVIVFLWCFRKVRFRKMQFLKDGVWTVALSQQGSHPGLSFNRTKGNENSNILHNIHVTIVSIDDVDFFLNQFTSLSRFRTLLV